MNAPDEVAASRWRAPVFAIVAYAVLVRIIFSACVELMPEETYYWNYSRHLDIGYLDHPPLTAWLIRTGTVLFGDTEFGVRFGALCCGVVASLFVYRLTRNVFGEAGALLALVFAQVLPFFFMSGMLMTPDAPLTAAWAASLYFLERALIAGRPHAWLAVGLSIGIGLISKYTIGMVGVAACIFMLIDPPSRRWFRRWEPYAGVLIAAAVFSPVIVWNAQHDWASFVFQTSRRLAERPRFSLHKLIGAAIVLITPTGVFAVCEALARGPSRFGAPAARGSGTASGDAPASGGAARAWRLLQLSLFVPIVVFFGFSLRHEVKLDWTGAPWVAALPVMAFALRAAYAGRASGVGAGGESAGAGGASVGASLGVGVGVGVGVERGSAGRGLRAAWISTILLLLLIYGAGSYYLVVGIPGLGYTSHTELIPVGWREFGREVDGIVDEIRAQHGDEFLVVGMDRYAIASELAFYSRDRSRSIAHTSAAHLFGDMGLMYEQWFPPQMQAGKTLLLVGWTPDSLEASHLEKHVGELGPVREWTLARRGHVVRHYYYRVAYNYRP